MAEDPIVYWKNLLTRRTTTLRERAERAEAVALWLWNDLREVERMHLRADEPELAAYCKALESVAAEADESVRASDDTRTAEQ